MKSSAVSSRKGNTVPVILLTARDAVMDKVAGLDGGAVDYITKPFAIEELLARIRVALKLHGSAAAAKKTAEPGNLTWRKLSLSEQRHQVTWAGEEISLTNREFRMLKTLLENRDIVLSRETLLEKVCGYGLYGRDQCGGRLCPVSPLQDRRGIRGKNDPDGAGRGICDQGRTGRMI